eukprot:61601-Prorocentrum_minimum.AAC.5
MNGGGLPANGSIYNLHDDYLSAMWSADQRARDWAGETATSGYAKDPYVMQQVKNATPGRGLRG